MLVIPALDIRGGRVVRLRQGDPTRETEYSVDPVSIARGWQEQGARLLHVVDLDGAFAGRPQNLETVTAITRAVRIPVQVGGGLRALADIEAVLAGGAARAVVGTAAVKTPELLDQACRRFPGRVLLSIDAKDGVVAVEGWGEETSLAAVDLAGRVAGLPLGTIVYTDIQRDGTMWGANMAGIRAMLSATRIPLIASGGVASLEDLLAVAELEPLGLVGVIIGKALYSGALDLGDALRAVGGLGAR